MFYVRTNNGATNKLANCSTPLFLHTVNNGQKGQSISFIYSIFQMNLLKGAKQGWNKKKQERYPLLL
jgi:hypothetical protein